MKKESRYPLKDKDGNIIWKNLFKMDIVSVLFLIAIILLITSYVHDTKACREINEDPCGYCESHCNCIVEEQEYIGQEEDSFKFELGG